MEKSASCSDRQAPISVAAVSESWYEVGFLGPDA